MVIYDYHQKVTSSLFNFLQSSLINIDYYSWILFFWEELNNCNYFLIEKINFINHLVKKDKISRFTKKKKILLLISQWLKEEKIKKIKKFHKIKMEFKLLFFWDLS